jgi:enoyl-CoA hydratase/carnithine racemase
MTIRYEKQGNVAIFTLDNPKVNALTPPMHKQFHDMLIEFGADQDIHVGILTGAGDRAFCGGDDIKNDWGYSSLEKNLDAHFWPSTEANSDRRPGYDREVALVTRYKPIIGAINGPAMGQGLMYLFMHTDLRIATPNARFGFPEIAYGMGGASGLTQIGRHLPTAVAMWMLLTGEPLSAEDALKHSFLNELVEPDRLMDRAMEIALKIAAHPPLAVRVEMEVFQRSLDLPRAESVAFANHLYRLQRAAYLTKPGTTATPLGGHVSYE